MSYQLMYRPADGDYAVVLDGDDADYIDPAVFRAAVHFKDMLLRIYLNMDFVVRIPLQERHIAEGLAGLDTLQVSVIKGDTTQHLRAEVKVVGAG